MLPFFRYPKNRASRYRFRVKPPNPYLPFSFPTPLSIGVCPSDWGIFKGLLELGIFFRLLGWIQYRDIGSRNIRSYWRCSYTLLPCFHLMVSNHAANPVGAVSEFIAQLQILELLDNVSNHASWIILQESTRNLAAILNMFNLWNQILDM